MICREKKSLWNNLSIARQLIRTINQYFGLDRRRGRSIERFAGEVESGYHVTGHSSTG